MSVLSVASMMEQKPVAIAPKDGPLSKDSANGEGEPCMPYTCLTCAKRKVKCDKVAPKCSTCRKARLDCVYQEPAPRKRKRKPAEDVHERLEQYEKILKENGLLPGEESTTQQYRPDKAEPEWPFLLSTIGNKGSTLGAGGKLVGAEGKARYIGSTVFKNLGDELEVSSDEEGGDDEAPTSIPYQHITLNDPMSMAFLSPNSSYSSLLDFHPTYETAMKLWKFYVDNVDPVVKAVHVPTMQKILQRAAAQPSAIPRPTEALLFAIYHFGILSLTEDECLKIFNETKKSLLARYETALRQALVNAQWLRSTNLAVVQAFVLFLLSVRSSYDPQTFWILTGVVVRLGQRIGLHRDGEELGLGPFEIQMRRRIFWQLLPLDGLAGQLSGTGICITLDSWSTKQPLNLNDTDIWPEMTETPDPRTGATDMIFCLARTEMAKIVRHAFSNKDIVRPDIDDPMYSQSLRLKDDHLSALEDEMERKYLRYCDFADPLHQLTMAMARAGVAGGRLRIRLPRARMKVDVDMPEEERKELWALANKILDYHISANINQVLSRYWWHLKAFFQSDALVWVLNEIRRDPGRYNDESTWDKIETTYSNHPDLAGQKRSLHTAVGRLTIKAWDSIQTWRQQNNQPCPAEPAFITNIRLRPSRRESTFPSNDPTPESAAGWTYNPFNPGDGTDDFTMPHLDSNSSFKSNIGTVGSGPQGLGVVGPLVGFGAGQGQIFNEFDFSQYMNADTGGVDWVFWDQMSRDPNAFAMG